MFNSQNIPRISCLMVTASGRFDYAKRSIKCFAEQTYPNKELVLVNEGPKEYQANIESYLSSLNISATLVWLNGKYTLGELRNISIYAASGDITCQWDDDDFSYPTRLYAQYSRMTNAGTVASYLTNQLHYYFNGSMLYWDDWSRYGNDKQFIQTVIPGTLMLYRHLPFRYPETGEFCKAGEDSVILADLLNHVPEKKVLRISDIGWMYVYSQHGCNQVYDKEHHYKISEMRSHRIGYMLDNKSDIEKALDYFQFGNVFVMSREGVAFEYTSS